MFSDYWNEHTPTFSDESSAYEDLFAQAAKNFPPNDGKPLDDVFTDSALSPFSSSSSSSSSAQSPYSPDIGPESDSDSDVDPLLLEELMNEQPYRPKSLPNIDMDTPSLPPLRHISRATKPLPNRSATHTLSHSPPVVACTTSSRRLVRNPSHSSIFSAGSDDEADGESDSSGTDDEYVPSPVLAPHKRRRSSTTPSKYHKKLPITILATDDQCHQSPTKRPRLPPPPRNKQVLSEAQYLAAVGAAKRGNVTCPACHWVQTNKRMPDYKRHLKTHLKPETGAQPQGWRCKGVLLKDAVRYRIPGDAKPFLFMGQWRIGGCEIMFSRRDALKRHLDNGNVSCVGRPRDATEE